MLSRLRGGGWERGLTAGLGDWPCWEALMRAFWMAMRSQETRPACCGGRGGGSLGFAFRRNFEMGGWYVFRGLEEVGE